MMLWNHANSSSQTILCALKTFNLIRWEVEVKRVAVIKFGMH